MGSGFHFHRRSSGLLMHLTSLPGKHGSGDLGSEAFEFVDFLVNAKQTWWQTLPVNPPGARPGYSPYSAPSSFAGSPFLISIDRLVDAGLISRTEARPRTTFSHEKVLFDDVAAHRERCLRVAWENARKNLPKAFSSFCKRHASWLDTWAAFAALRRLNRGVVWTKWKKTDPAMIDASEIGYHKFVQYLFYSQWDALRRYANSKGVGLIGDVPIFAGHDSADAWSQRHLFLLDKRGNPTVVTGCPPDMLNKNGQVWNHAHYNWPEHVKEKFAWWVSRFAATFELFDGVRIDHFLGFYRMWAIPAGNKHGRVGKWLFTPGRELFTQLRKRLGDVAIIAEDLGTVTEQALKLRDDFGFPGMVVLQFAFGGTNNPHLPIHYKHSNFVCYTGTHDTDTASGFFTHLARTDKQQIAKARVITGTDLKRANEDLIRLGMNSIANTIILPTQDVLGLGSEARMNQPGTVGINWSWRMKPRALTQKHASMLATLTTATERDTRHAKPSK
jgi:4-alpha-glucanotransferase